MSTCPRNVHAPQCFICYIMHAKSRKKWLCVKNSDAKWKKCGIINNENYGERYVGNYYLYNLYAFAGMFCIVYVLPLYKKGKASE